MTPDAFRVIHIHCNLSDVTKCHTDENYIHTFTEELDAAFLGVDCKEFAVSFFTKAFSYSDMFFLTRFNMLN